MVKCALNVASVVDEPLLGAVGPADEGDPGLSVAAPREDGRRPPLAVAESNLCLRPVGLEALTVNQQPLRDSFESRLRSHAGTITRSSICRLAQYYVKVRSILFVLQPDWPVSMMSGPRG